MKTLIEKELRLMLPAFCAAMALAIVPVWVSTTDPRNAGATLYMFGTMLLALSVFGREIGFKTLPFIMAQPLERSRIWWTKIAVLGVLAVLVFDAWWLSGSLVSIMHPARSLPWVDRNSFVLWSVVLMAGGLWMTLLLRQVVAAFWLNLLAPGALAGGIEIFGGPDWLIYTALGLYAVAGFFLARREFLRLQDTAWTGGVISFGSGRSVSVDRPRARRRRVWAALIAKEFQIQQVTLAGIICLAVLHMGVLVARTLGANSFSKMTLLALGGFGFLWFAVPLIAGSQSVAEERQLGTLEPILCLPVSRRVQFAVKIMFVLVIGGLLSAALFCGIEKFAGVIGLKADISIPAIYTVIAFVALSIAGVYASSLTRGIVPALGVAVLTVIGLFACLRSPRQPVEAFGFRFFEGSLWTFLGVPLVLIVLAWLAYRNFGSVWEGWRLWRRSVVAVAVTLAINFGLTTAFYHRAWELLGPLEPAHGAARIPLGTAAPATKMRSYSFGLAALLPDGRLWNDALYDEPRWILWGTGLGETWRSQAGNTFVPGSNWVDAVDTSRETAAIKSDGTLWVSERPQEMGRSGNFGELMHPEKPAPLVQLGHDTDWQSIAPRTQSRVILLKRDGTLWELGTSYSALKTPSLRDQEPRQIGSESDWATFMRDGANDLLLWEKDGTAWGLRGVDAEKLIIPGLKVIEKSADFQVWETSRLSDGKLVHRPGIGVEPLPGLDNVRMRSAAATPDYLGITFVRDNGTLWLWDWREDRIRRGRAGLRAPGGSPPVQIGKDADWADFVSAYYSLVARKTDGSLWKWDYNPSKHEPLAALEKPPVRLSSHNDWVGLVSVGWRTVSLAADGGLWMWPWPEEQAFTSGKQGERLGIFLEPSRKPEQIENIFGGTR